MQLPVIIEASPDRHTFTARVAALDLSATADTAEQAHQRLVALLQSRIDSGMELRTISVPVTGTSGSDPGWLPDDELTNEWLKHVEEYRAECDAADRARL